MDFLARLSSHSKPTLPGYLVDLPPTFPSLAQGRLPPARALLRNCHRLSWDGRIRTIGLSVLVSQLAPPLQRSTSFFHSRVACVRAMDFLARDAVPCEGFDERSGGPQPWQPKLPRRTLNALPSQGCRRTANQPCEGSRSIYGPSSPPWPRALSRLPRGGTLARDAVPFEGFDERSGGPQPWQPKPPHRTLNALPWRGCRRTANQPCERTRSIDRPPCPPWTGAPCRLPPGATLLRDCHRLSRDGRIRTIALSVLVSQLALPLQRSTGFFHSRVACVRAMDFLAMGTLVGETRVTPRFPPQTVRCVLLARQPALIWRRAGASWLWSEGGWGRPKRDDGRREWAGSRE